MKHQSVCLRDLRSSACICGRYNLRQRPAQSLVMEPAPERHRDFAKRLLQFLATAAAFEIAGAVANLCLHFVVPADAVHGDGDHQITKLLTETKRSAKPGHELPFVRRLEKNVTGVELKHQSLLSGKFSQKI
jgi:hypothetical protein